MSRRSASPTYPGQYQIGQLPLINLGYLKSLCDNNNIQMNFILRPDQIELKFSRIDPYTNLLNKSEKHIIKNKDIANQFSARGIELIINNLLLDVYPTNMMRT
jgi:hypothetical protein